MLIEAAAGRRIYAPTLLAATAGLRRGEILALKWSNVDLNAGTVCVMHALEQTKAGGLRIKMPKSGAGRIIALPSMTVAALREHATAQKRDRLKRGKEFHNNDLVCPNTIGTFWDPRSVSRAFKLLVDKLDIPPVTFHGLRHSHISHLLQEGVHPKVASERAGHSSVSVTLDVYSHAIPDMQKDAAARIDELLRSLELRK